MPPIGFITYESPEFSDLSKNPTVLFSAERTTWVFNVMITNKSKTNIRIFLEKVSLLNDPIKRAFRAHNKLIEPNQTIDIILDTMTLNNGENLVCYSDGFSSVFDCIVDLGILNELNDDV